MVKILNLYAGIGGNRKLWKDCEVTAVEQNKQIAYIYSELYPNDRIIVGCAHKYLLKHIHEKWDFIWSSPPCPTHSGIRRCGVQGGLCEAMYPDLALYQEITLLKHFSNPLTNWVVENVRPYYIPWIEGYILGRHMFWSNFIIYNKVLNDKTRITNIEGSSKVYGFQLLKGVKNRRQILRNLVNPELGLHIYNNNVSSIT